MSGVHLYLHVPFCARKCSYCDFAIAVRSRTPDAEYLEALRREWDGWQAHPSLAEADTLRTVYFGGGTPSRLEPATIAALLVMLTRDRALESGAEVTLEANPDDVTPERAREWARAGITRVSLGAQSHDQQVLDWMHRTHRAEQVPLAVSALRGAGITDISLDLIFALPPEVPRNWSTDLDTTLALQPTHISLYGLTVESHTPLARWKERGEVHEAPGERYADEYLAAHERLVDTGMQHYEVSNASLPGYGSRHNAAYWSGAEYLGMGPSAHSFLGGERSWNTREWVAYRDQVMRTGAARDGAERLTGEQQRLERRYLDLRTRAGTPLEGLDPARVASWEAARWARREGARLVLTAEGWLRLDALVAQLERP